MESAYDSERAICSDQSELFDELVEDCRIRWEADESCAGVLGFEGVLEGVDVVVESDLVITELDQIQTSEGPIVREGVNMVGKGPYFVFTLGFSDIGGPIDNPDSFPRAVEIGPSDDLDDLFISSSFRISTGAESRDFSAIEGELVTTVQNQTEQVSTFRIAFAGGDEISGCFHAFGTEFKLEAETP